MFFHLKNHFFKYIVTILTILAVGASYYRFMVSYEYLVSYEGDCNPYTESCFLYCEDDECSDPFFYSIIERQAHEVRALCGEDVTTCDAAYECQDDVDVCTVYYCDPVLDGDECEILTEDDYVPDFSEQDV